MLVLSGICFYAVFNHLNIALRRPFNRSHFWFAWTCLAAALALFAQIQAYHAHTTAVFVSAIKWNISFIFIAFIFFHWFIAEHSGVRPRPYLISITVLFIFLFALNLIAPYSLQYRDLTDLQLLHLPWGEVVTVPVGYNGVWFKIGVTAVLTDFGFAIYALLSTWRRHRSPTNLAMLLAIGLFVLAALEGIAVRMAAIHFIHLGLFGFLAMILAMSVVLTYETQQRLRDSERRFRSLVEQSPFSIQVMSPSGYTEQVNPAWEHLWGIKLDRLKYYNILNDEQLVIKGIMPYIVKGFSGNATEIPPIVYNPADNRDVGGPENNRWVRAYIYPIMDEAKAIRDMILMHEDVTERKRVEDAIRFIAAGVSSVNGEQLFEQMVLNLAKVFEADFAFIALLDKRDANYLNVFTIIAPNKVTPDKRISLADTPFANILEKGTCVFPNSVQDTFPDDRFLADIGIQALMGAPLYDGDHILGILVVMHSQPLTHVEQAGEILEIFATRVGTELHRQQTQARIHQLAYQDYLTGLANRAQLHEHLTMALQRASHDNREGALLLIDLDHFKTINDALGHDVGDEVLRAVANRIIESCGENVFLARLGGDEFVALMESTGDFNENRIHRYAHSMAQRILDNLTRPIFTGDRAFTVGASIGIVCFPEHEQSALDVLRHADMALYQAKHMGRGIIQRYLPDLEVAATNRLHLEAGLRSAIDNNELEIYFQPLVDAVGNPIGAEVLLRWRSAKLGDISPCVFIPVAEDTGLIHSIGGWVFNQACARLKQWLRDGVPFIGHLSINVCPWQFARPDFVSDLHETVLRHQIDPQRLTLELTETALLYDITETVVKLKTLRTMGFNIALDDFGTGYSSLAYLRDLPLDQLKIDKDFISELSTTVEHPLVGSMIAIGKHMKLAVIAEGVETEMQRDKLMALGCEHFQGFLFCHPLPERDYLAWLSSGKTAKAHE